MADIKYESINQIGVPWMSASGWAKMPRRLRSNPETKHQAIKLRKESTPAE